MENVMQSNEQYQKNELERFINQESGYFDCLADFEEKLEGMDIFEQIEWMENGSYGAGVCLALQIAFAGLNKRTNDNARIGNVVLKALYGKTFKQWNKLSATSQKRLNKAVEKWLKQTHEWAIDCFI
jgi:hypothetical protein